MTPKQILGIVMFSFLCLGGVFCGAYKFGWRTYREPVIAIAIILYLFLAFLLINDYPCP